MATEPPNTDWSLANDQGYVLNRSHAHTAACRLNLQFYLWKDAIKFNIHPSIPVKENSIIADVAAGTGMWLIDVARELPMAQLDGFDNNLAQAPHSKWLPPSITMHYWNIFDDLPDDLIGKYDIVHVRLLVLVIEHGNPKPVIRNLFKMLKPGGYLQWDELDCVNMHVKKVDPKAPAPALEKLREMSWADGRHDWTLQLPGFMTEEGFDDATVEHFGDRDDLIRACNEQHLLTMDEFATALTKMGKKEAAGVFYQAIKDGYEESTKGAALCIPRIVCVACKPK